MVKRIIYWAFSATVTELLSGSIVQNFRSKFWRTFSLTNFFQNARLFLIKCREKRPEICRRSPLVYQGIVSSQWSVFWEQSRYDCMYLVWYSGAERDRFDCALKLLHLPEEGYSCVRRWTLESRASARDKMVRQWSWSTVTSFSRWILEYDVCGSRGL